MTANWEAKRSADTWLVPIGGGFGKIFRIGSQPMNVNVQGFRMVESPRYGPNWEARLQCQICRRSAIKQLAWARVPAPQQYRDDERTRRSPVPIQRAP